MKVRKFYKFVLQRSFYYDTHDTNGELSSDMTESEWKQSIIDWVKSLEDNAEVQEVLYIFHDLDTNEDGTTKGLHVHFVITLLHNRTHSAAIKFFGASSVRNCEPIKSYVGAVQYLIHVSQDALSDCKHIYSPDLVSGFYRDSDGVVLPITVQQYQFRMAGKRSRQRKNEAKKVRSDCLKMVLSGESVVSDVLEVYDKDLQNVGLSAIDFISDRRLYADAAQIWLQRIREYYLQHDCPLVSIYISGAGGTGKTTLAEAFARSVSDCHGIHHVAAPNGNTTFDFVGNYQGERVSIFNEFSPHYDINGFLNSFDPLKASSVGSRFSDKIYFANYALFTTSLPLESFIYELFKTYAKIFSNISKDKRKNLVNEIDWYREYLSGLPETDDKILQIRRRIPIKCEIVDKYLYISVLDKRKNVNKSFLFENGCCSPYAWFCTVDYDVDSVDFSVHLKNAVSELHKAVEYYFKINCFSVDFSLPDFSGGE